MDRYLDKIKQDVADLLSFDKSGHGFDHTLRVYEIAIKLSESENANTEIVALSALLHDADDYKLFGEENAKNLTNARKIMTDSNISEEIQNNVCDIILNMGYSKLLKGIRPNTPEGKIVSDSDMMDAIGANGMIRTLHFHLDKIHKPYFDKNLWPNINVSYESYKNPNRETDNFINHFFEKMLKLKNLMLTDTGREYATKRHEFMVIFLRNFFDENNLPEWNEFLDKYLSEN